MLGAAVTCPIGRFADSTQLGGADDSEGGEALQRDLDNDSWDEIQQIQMPDSAPGTG